MKNFLNKFKYLLIGLGFALSYTVYAVNVTVPQATQKGSLPVGLTTGNYQILNPGSDGLFLRASSTTASGYDFATASTSGGTGLTNLNGLVAGTQTFATTTSGTVFTISSSGSAHTFTFPASPTFTNLTYTGQGTFGLASGTSASLSGNLWVTGQTSLGNASSSALTVSGLSRFASTTITGTLNVSGSSTISSLGTGIVQSTATGGLYVVPTNTYQPAGTYVTNVTASGNIASSGGTTPNITFTGVLPLANGGIATTTLGNLTVGSNLSVTGGQQVLIGTSTQISLGTAVVTSVSTSSSGSVFTGSISSNNLALVFPVSPTFTTLTVTGQTTLGNASATALTVSGVSTLATTSIAGTLSVTGVPTFSGVSNCNGTSFLQITSGQFGCATPVGGGGGAGGGWATSTTANGLIITNTSGGAVGINSSTPWATLVVQGLSASTTPVFVVATSTGSPLLRVAGNGSTTLSSLGTGPVYSSTGSLYTNGTTGTGLTVQQTSPTLITPILGTASGTALTLSDNLWVTGNTALTGTLNVTGKTTLGNASTTNLSVTTNAYLTNIASGNCLQTGAGGLITGTGSACGSGGSGNSAWTIGSGLIYNATSTDLVGIGTSTPANTLTVAGKAGVNPFVVASSTGSSLFTITQAGNAVLASNKSFTGLGNVNIQSVAGSNIAIFTENPETGSGGTAGSINLSAGDGDGVGSGGIISIAPGDTTGANAAPLFLYGGNANAGNSDGGSIFIIPGYKSGSGTRGIVKLYADQAASYAALLDMSLMASSDKTFTFPNKTGTFALDTSFVPGSNITITTSTPGVITIAATGGSGNSAWTIGNGVIYNATSTDLIGIGTTTPNYKLSVVATAGNTNIFNVASSSGTSVFRVFDGTQTYYPAMAGYAVAGAPWVYLNAGAVATPTYSFNGSQTTGMYMPSTDFIGFSTAGVGRMAIGSGGQVGIGTLTPTTTQSALLHLDNTSFARIMVTASTSPNQVVGFFDARADTVSRWQMGTKSNHPMVFLTNDTARLGIWASGGLAYGSTYSFTNDPGANTAIFEGSVGIGTSTPAYKLSVVGTAGNNPVLNIASSTGATMFSVGVNGSTTVSNLTAGLVRSTAGGSLYSDSGTYPTGGGATSKIAYWNSASNLTSNTNLNYNGSLFAFNTTLDSAVDFKVQGGSSGASSIFNVTSSTGTSLLSVASNGSTTLSSLASAGCVASSASGQLYVTSCGGGSLSGGTNGYLTRWLSASTVSSGVSIDNGTVAGVNATSSTVSFNVQGTTTLDPFNVSSSSTTSILRVTSLGNVGIGTTTPAYRLTVVGTAGNNPVLNIASSTGVSLLHVGANGKVGIGTTTPQGMLDIADTSSTTKPSILFIGDNLSFSCIGMRSRTAKTLYYVYLTDGGGFATSSTASTCQ